MGYGYDMHVHDDMTKPKKARTREHNNKNMCVSASVICIQYGHDTHFKV